MVDHVFYRKPLKPEPSTLEQAITHLLFENDIPLYEDREFWALITARTNEEAVTGLLSGDTWKATFMLIERAREGGLRYRLIYDEASQRRVRDELTRVLKNAGAGRNRGPRAT